MHDEYSMRRIAGSAIDASPIRRLDCAGFQLDVDSGSPEARDDPSRTLRSVCRLQEKTNARVRLVVGQTRGLTSYK